MVKNKKQDSFQKSESFQYQPQGLQNNSKNWFFFPITENPSEHKVLKIMLM